MKVELSRQSNCQYIQGKQDSLAVKVAVKLLSCHAVMLSYSQAVKQLPICQAVKLLNCQGNLAVKLSSCWGSLDCPWIQGHPVDLSDRPWIQGHHIDLDTAPKIRDTLVICWLPLKSGTPRCPWFHGYAPYFIGMPLISGSFWVWHFGKFHKSVNNFACTLVMKFIFSDSCSTNITWILDKVFTAWI